MYCTFYKKVPIYGPVQSQKSGASIPFSPLLLSSVCMCMCICVCVVDLAPTRHSQVIRPLLRQECTTKSLYGPGPGPGPALSCPVLPCPLGRTFEKVGSLQIVSPTLGTVHLRFVDATKVQSTYISSISKALPRKEEEKKNKKKKETGGLCTNSHEKLYIQ
ncbi:hypothetical protein GGR50DRAFT_305521 [Xylaria sp. CBS 124048]|nr:hypothetical protein GGR50DRAFT_305521 [Xylaria sp. CBS 124048]